MARTVIALHEERYKGDFERYGTDQLCDSQEHRPYTFDEVNINKICLIKGHNGEARKIILAIETADGSKGLFVDTCMNSFIKKFE